MRSTRNRAIGLCSGAIPVVKGTAPHPAPLSKGEKAQSVLNKLIRQLPVGKHVLIPRSHAEAHNRADSMCVLLGLPFHVIGPLLMAAAILVVQKQGGQLAVASNGFDTLVNSFQ